MHKRHAAVIAVFLGLAILLGGFGALRTAGISAASQGSSDAQITARQHRLDQAERQLRQALARKPPALPAVSRPRSRPAQRIEYVRPAPIVITRPSGEREHEDGESGDHEAEAFDD